MLFALLLAGTAIAIAVLILAAAQPAYFVVQRSTTIEASPDAVFALIHDFRQWAHWSPWEQADAARLRRYSGAPRGRGARYAWSGCSRGGVGEMEILAATPASQVRIQLELEAPVRLSKKVDFTLQPRGDATQVTWSVQGPTPYMARLRHFLRPRGGIDRDFELGLSRMKAWAEGSTRKGAAS